MMDQKAYARRSCSAQRKLYFSRLLFPNHRIGQGA